MRTYGAAVSLPAASQAAHGVDAGQQQMRSEQGENSLVHLGGWGAPPVRHRARDFWRAGREARRTKAQDGRFAAGRAGAAE